MDVRILSCKPKSDDLVIKGEENVFQDSSGGFLNIAGQGLRGYFVFISFYFFFMFQCAVVAVLLVPSTDATKKGSK